MDISDLSLRHFCFPADLDSEDLDQSSPTIHILALQTLYAVIFSIKMENWTVAYSWCVCVYVNSEARSLLNAIPNKVRNMILASTI